MSYFKHIFAAIRSTYNCKICDEQFDSHNQAVLHIEDNHAERIGKDTKDSESN